MLSTGTFRHSSPVIWISAENTLAFRLRRTGFRVRPISLGLGHVRGLRLRCCPIPFHALGKGCDSLRRRRQFLCYFRLSSTSLRRCQPLAHPLRLSLARLRVGRKPCPHLLTVCDASLGISHANIVPL